MIHKNTAYNIATNRRVATEVYCEEIVGYQIRKSAIEGFSNITVEVPFSIDLKYALEIIRKNEFDVSTDNAVMYIKWGEGKEDEI